MVKDETSVTSTAINPIFNECDSQISQQNTNKEAIWLYAELFLGHHDGSCHGLW